MVFVALMCVLGSAAAGPLDSTTDLMSMMDAMQHMVDPSKPQFDRQFLASLDGCMNSLDVNLKASQDAAWKGFVEYAVVPKAGDVWGNDCVNEPNGTCDHYEGV
jgi:hypothetical protein